MNNIIHYKTPLDIASFFSEDEIESTLEFIIKEAVAFADEIDNSGNQIPYPIIRSEEGNIFQIEFQFMIHALAKCVAFKTNNNHNYVKIIEDFAIYSESLSDETKNKNRYYLAMIMEYMLKITKLSNITKGRNSSIRYWKGYFNFLSKLVKFNNKVFLFKAVSLGNSLAIGKQPYGLSQYMDWDKYRNRFDVEEQSVQVSAGKGNKNYLKENNITPWVYMFISLENSKRIINYKDICNLDNLNTDNQ